MSPEEKFINQREAFRLFIVDLDDRELELLMNDIQLRLDYIQNLKLAAFHSHRN